MSEWHSREATRETYDAAVRHMIFDTNPDNRAWERTLFEATEEDGVGHSGASWGFALHQIRRMRDIGSWAEYVSWFLSAR